MTELPEPTELYKLLELHLHSAWIAGGGANEVGRLSYADFCEWRIVAIDEILRCARQAPPEAEIEQAAERIMLTQGQDAETIRHFRCLKSAIWKSAIRDARAALGVGNGNG